MVMSRTQTLVQLTDDLVARLDERAARTGRNRSSLIREAVEEYLHDEIEAEISRQIIEGYKRMPETEDEMKWAERNAIESIREEPW